MIRKDVDLMSGLIEAECEDNKAETPGSIVDITQGVPHYIECNGKELVRVFKKNKPLFYLTWELNFDGPPLEDFVLPNIGEVLINDNEYKLLIMRTSKDSIIVCIYHKTSIYFNLNTSNWCHDYFMFYVQLPVGEEPTYSIFNALGRSNEIFDLNKHHPLKLLSRLNGVFINVRPLHYEQYPQWTRVWNEKTRHDPVIIRDYVTCYMTEKIELKLRMYFDVTRDEYETLCKQGIQKLFFIKEVVYPYLDIYQHIRKTTSFIWRPIIRDISVFNEQR